LTVYFVKRVGIRDIRFFVDYSEDESYTPTKIVFKSGTSENNLVEFAMMELQTPVGWQQVPIAGSGGGVDGNTLVSYVFQMQILENHQNGKDTHLRGIKIYAIDTESATAGADGNTVDEMAGLIDDVAGHTSTPVLHGNTDAQLDILERRLQANRMASDDTGFGIPDFMREPELR
jgi:anaphase-promoting complex subunit 10